MILVGIAVSAFVASGFLAGCSAPSMEVDEAVKKIDAALDDTFAAVRPALKWRDGPARMSQHRNSFTNEEDGEITVSRDRYVWTKISKSKTIVLAKAVEKHWKAKGYDPEFVSRKGSFVEYETPEGISVTFEVRGDVVLIVAAIADTKYPGHSGNIDDGDFPNGLGDIGPVPNVRDPYWSK
ncbi:hypothetical protein [Streptomyces gilvosporeus]|uniref:hypothetical protein n=1 Tax=Streptomyces gilvosporeus TaxID=553510 RepID=UPI00131C99A4|nr:hypothetical protein [Streptomyces gilvosporeus]